MDLFHNGDQIKYSVVLMPGMDPDGVNSAARHPPFCLHFFFFKSIEYFLVDK